MTRAVMGVWCCILWIGALAAKPASQAEVGQAMTAAAVRFASTLDEAQRASALLAVDDPQRLDWHNIPKPKRKGLQLRDMNPRQREACHELLRAALSETGYDKAVKIMALENNLREGEKELKNGPLRDPQRYFLTLFGQPAASGAWGWSFEGHHFSLNFLLRDGQVVADTPSFWVANPATVRLFVPDGPEQGTRTLAQEEQLAFDLLNQLDAGQRGKAIIADKAPAEYRAGGQPQPPQTAPQGLPAAEMTASQQETLRALLSAYNGNLAAPLAAARMAEILRHGVDRVYFAWAGATAPGAEHYYRVQGPSFVLELVNYQADPAGNPANHIHSVWRNMEGDFGIPLR